MPTTISAALAAVLACAAAAGAAEAPAARQGQLADVVIKAEQKDEPSTGKPALDVPYDPYETLRATLRPDETLLLAQSPALATWTRSRPDRLKSERLLRPWNDALSQFSEIKLGARAALETAAGRPFEGKAAKGSSWSVSIVDEDGKPIRRFEGSGFPPETVAWDGLSDHGDFVRAGHAYSAVYKYEDGAAPARTALGRPIQYAGLARGTGDAQVLGLDSGALFGVDRRGRELAPAGGDLLRAAADWIRRRDFNAPALLRVYGPDGPTAQAQAAAVKAFLSAELGVPAERLAAEASAAPPSEQRVDLALGR